jgi:hypothetical protein
MSTGEPDATEIGHVRFGEGPSEKDQVNWHLVGGLLYCPLGSEGGCPEKARTHTGNGTSPRSPPCYWARCPSRCLTWRGAWHGSPTVCFSGRTYPQLARILRALWAVAGRCRLRLVAAVAVSSARAFPILT